VERGAACLDHWVERGVRRVRDWEVQAQPFLASSVEDNR
jgi:hypothetical protein